MKVKRKLPLLIIFLVVIPLLILSAITSLYVSKNSLETHKQSLLDITASITTYLEEFYKTQFNDLTFTSQIPIFHQHLRQPDNPLARERSEQLLGFSTNINSLVSRNALIDLSGKVLASSETNYIGTDLQSSNMYKTLILENKPTYDEVVPTEISDKKMLLLAVKIYDEDQKPIGILNRSVSIESVTQQTRQRKVGENGYIHILDSTAQPLFDFVDTSTSEENQTQPLNNDETLKKFMADIKNNRLKGNTGFFNYHYNKIPILANYQKVPGSDWVVVVSIPRDDVYKELETLQIALLLATFIIALISLFIGVYVARTITTPLTYLTEKIKAIQRENFSVRCELPGNDEFHAFSESINQMTKALETSKHELIKTNALLKKSAYIDGLTDIPNRKAIYHTMDTLFKKYNNQALFLFDLSGFEAISDTFGHYMGDAALVAVAKSLKNLSSENVHPARISGDEFLIFVSNFSTPADVMALANDLLKKIENIKMLREQPVNLSGSLGISFLSPKTTDRSEWIRQADEALFHAKQDEHKNFSIYEESHNSLKRN